MILLHDLLENLPTWFGNIHVFKRKLNKYQIVEDNATTDLTSVHTYKQLKSLQARKGRTKQQGPNNPTKKSQRKTAN